jgi:hypothetical protein
VLALFKHNIGAYALIGFSACLLLDGMPRRDPATSSDSEQQATRTSSGNVPLKLSKISKLSTLSKLTELAAMLLGFGTPVIPVLIYLAAQGALAAMLKTLLVGPGEFLVSRLAGAPSPVVPAFTFLSLAGVGWVIFALRSRPRAAAAIALLTLVAVSLVCLAGSESRVSDVLFYAPMLVVAAGIAALVYKHWLGQYARPIGPLVVAAAAAFMETFPRFAREQVIAAIPFVGLLLVYLVYCLWRLWSSQPDRRPAVGPAIAILPLAFLLLGLRFFHQTYFRGLVTLRSDTELSIDRGRGVYFPAETAARIDEITRFIQQRVPETGYIFPQSYAGSSFLFLADRRNPSAAQFWGGVGVSQAEQASTVAALDEKQVMMVITSPKDLAAEKYQPMREYIGSKFKQAERFGDIIILERNAE